MLVNNSIKEKVCGGRKVVGAFLNLESPPAAEILGRLGLDFVIIDTEHGPGDAESTANMIRACEVSGVTPVVRVKEADRTSVLKMLDIGAMGILIPFVKTPEEVRQLVMWGKYRPLGDRGFGMSRKNGYGLEGKLQGDIRAYFTWANENTLLIPQCETVECLEHIEEIAAIDGVDAIFVGPFDLSIALDIPRQFADPKFVQALKRIVAACKAANKLCFTLGGSAEDSKAMFNLGFDGVLAGDTSFLVAGATHYLQSLCALGCWERP